MKSSYTTTKEDSLAEKHLGIIAQRALYYWRFLPVGVRAYYDSSDMIGEVVLHVCLKSAKYNPRRAKASTWVWHVADNQCRSILSHYSRLRYSACEESALTNDTLEKVPVRQKKSEIREAANAVERVIEFSSDDVRDLLDQIFRRGIQQSRPRPEVVEDLRRAARQQHASLRDFELVYGCLTAG